MSGDIRLVKPETDEKDAEPAINPKLVDFPDRVRNAREFHGWTQSELAEAAGVEQPSISRYEQGKRLGRLSVDTVIKLSEALSVSLVWLATGEGPMFAGRAVRLREDRKRKSKSGESVADPSERPDKLRRKP